MREAKVTVTSPLTVAFNDAPDGPILADRVDDILPSLSVDDDVLVDVIGDRVFVLHKVTAA